VTEISELTAIGLDAATRAGTELLRRFGLEHDVLYTKSRGPADVVGRADLDAERLIVDVLRTRRPDDGVVTEEETSESGASGFCWIVDPLDGSFNYLRGIPHWAVSIACEAAGRWVLGVVHDPLRGETFSVSRDSPPMLNGRSWPAPPPARAVEEALVIGSLGYDKGPEARRRMAELASRLHASVSQIRISGAAALDLAWTALGRCDAFYHEDWPAVWDIAGGVALAEAAGLVTRRVPALRPGLSEGVLVARPALADALGAVVAPTGGAPGL
jgi:myo-inositol-1(or 4)-monophosphatase